MKYLNFPIEVYYDEDVYIARCNTLQGAFAEGETPQEAIKELMSVIEMILQDKAENKNFETVSDRFFTTLPIAVGQ
ncbi:MAG: type II toxin-antitoxin system HicB family antitoxin [Campylobacterales bacterium]|nr:type II toxin-antitoxin system HicB family antitoxin [Campylobacterales bacterium]